LLLSILRRIDRSDRRCTRSEGSKLSRGDLSFCVRRGRTDDCGDAYFCARFDYSDFGTAGRRAARFVAALAGVTILLSGFANVDVASAQTPSAGILAPGNAIVTGFSGAPPPAQIAPGQDPGDLTFIDPNGPSASVFNLQAPGAPPQAQVLPVPNPFTVTAAEVGQVFGVALDNATPPNMYVAASSAYGLPIVVPGQGGAPARVHQGAPGASFMAGLFGPSAQGGGPGSIWRIDGVSGAVGLFANVMLNGVANSGPALGGLAFDAASNSLLVADRQTGMIQRFGLQGALMGQFDHGVQGLAATGQPPVPYAPSSLDITSSQFSSDDPSTWHYAAPSRLIFGLAVHGDRLYYAVAAGLQIWSVSVAPDGSFGADARMEVQVPPALGPSEISKIVFDDSGDMLLAERAAPTGDYELMAVAQPGIGRVLRYAPVPVSVASGAPVAPGSSWQLVPDQYAIGFPGQLTNANGGVAIGYSYDANGNLDGSSCGGFLWSSGEELRNAADPNLAALLASNGTLNLNGLQGNAIELVEPANVPPLLTYFVDYAAPLDDPAARGHMGDIAIPRTCGQAAGYSIPGLFFEPPPWLPPWWFTPIPPPASYCPPSQISQYGQCCPPSQKVINGACTCPGGLPPGPNGQCACSPGTSAEPGFQCCPFGNMPNSAGQCAPICPNGATDPKSVTLCLFGFNPVPVNGVYDCLNGTVPPQQIKACIAQSPLVTATTCPDGWAKVNDPNLGVSICEPTPQEKACQAQGMNVGLNGTCQDICAPGSFPYPTTQCCANGETPLPNGMCCAAGAVPNPYTGQCCPPGSHVGSNGQCVQIPPNCPPGQMTVTGICCPAGKIPQPNGSCEPPPPPNNSCKKSGGTLNCEPLHNVICPIFQEVKGGCCPSGSTPTPSGTCVAKGQSCGTDPSMCCPGGSLPDFATGQCCPAGATQITGANPACKPPPPPPPPSGACMRGYVKVGDTCCAPNQVTSSGQCCPAGQSPTANGTCQPVIRILLCPAGQTFNLRTHTCDPDPACPPSIGRAAIGVCACPANEKINASGKCVAACSDGEVMNPLNGRCARKTSAITTPPPAPLTPAPLPTASCAAGYTLTDGTCVRGSTGCPPGEVPGPNGCMSAQRPPSACPSGQTIVDGKCACPAGHIADAGGACVCPPRGGPCAVGQVQGPDCNCLAAPTTTTCGTGEELVNGHCQCLPGEVLDPQKGGCVPGLATTPTPPTTPGTSPNPTCTVRGEVVVDGHCQCPTGEAPKDGSCMATSPPVGTKTLTPQKLLTPPPKKIVTPPPKPKTPTLKLPSGLQNKQGR
jgi:hypothetical protein